MSAIMKAMIQASGEGDAIHLVLVPEEGRWKAFVGAKWEKMIVAILDPYNGIEPLVKYGDTPAEALSNLDYFLQRWY